jgi:L-ascorbate metabolism protein UlaG (beta-lactamase superfamily)
MVRILTILAAWTLMPGIASASICHTFVNGPPGLRYATLDLAEAPPVAPEVAIDYIAHSTYRIESPGGIAIATDYFGAHGQSRGYDLPDVVTMNHAHSTHYTDNPDPGIGHVLRGWNPTGDGPAEHHLEVGDVLVRNVTTDIRGWGTPEPDGNSIFVFEVADLCIGHLGHIHHQLDEARLAMLGRIDVLMVPVDGTYTLGIPDTIELVKRLRSSMVLPMHAFGPSSMQRFLDGLAGEFAIRHVGDTAVRVSLETLPREPTVMVLSNHPVSRRD